MKNDDGYIEFGAVFFLFFIAAIIAGCALYASSAINYSKASNRDFDNNLKADLLLDEIIEKMQPLALYGFDDKNNNLIISLHSEYSAYNLEIEDASSGWNLNFISDADLSDIGITSILFNDSSGAAFFTWRTANGLSVSKESWKEFIKEEAYDHVTDCGWLHRNGTASFAYRQISASYGVTDPEKLFPLVNNFPRMNINMVDPEILLPVLTRNSFAIERQNEKAGVLITRLKESSLTRSDIVSIMRVTENHPIMGYLGTKTAFWKINFTTAEALKVEALVAAMPLKNGAPQEIESYKLINRSIEK